MFSGVGAGGAGANGGSGSKVPGNDIQHFQLEYDLKY